MGVSSMTGASRSAASWISSRVTSPARVVVSVTAGGYADILAVMEVPTGRARRLESGTAFVLCFAAGAVALVVFIVLAAPGLREQVLAAGGIDERDVVASSGRWAIVATLRDATGCVGVEVDGALADRTCTTEAPAVLGTPHAIVTDAEDRWFVTGFAARDVPLVRVDLSNGAELVVRTRGVESGYPASYWATLVEPGVAVDRVVAIDTIDTPIGERACPDGPLLTAEGPGC